MKTHFLLPLVILFTLLSSFYVQGQPPKGERGKSELSDSKKKQERVQQYKIAYFTKELDLSTEEAEKFWPLYNEMSEKIKAEKRKARSATRNVKENLDSMSDAQVKAKLDEAMNARIREAELQKDYINKIGDVIGFKKTAKLVSLEIQFKRELLRRLSEQKNESNANEE